ncbi:hypothetical protein P7H21_17035 [Paenibacillus larvae]|nr:hypothetical protein [Paenibacillus larvae]MDT2305310.1 hypothetical protein [Paenibacillus larvae]
MAESTQGPTKRPTRVFRSKQAGMKICLWMRASFQDLQQKYPEICGWESSRKLGTIDNELTRFRYDVMLRVNKKHAREENRRPSLSVQSRYTWKNVRYCASCKDLEHLLETRGIEKGGTVVDQSAIAAMPADNPPGVNKPEDFAM